MNPRHSHHLRHVTRTWLLALVAVLGMIGSMIQPASAQVSSPTATQFFEAVDSGSLMASASGATVLYTPLGSFNGAGGPAEFGRALQESFSYIEFTTNSFETVEHLVIVRFTMTAVHTGAFKDLPGSCAGITVPGVAIMRFGYRMAVAEHDDSASLGQHLDSAYTVQSVVTEQWIGYDERTIERQITAVNLIPQSQRANCFDQTPNLPVMVDTAPESPTLPPATDEPAQWGTPY